MIFVNRYDRKITPLFRFLVMTVCSHVSYSSHYCLQSPRRHPINSTFRLSPVLEAGVQVAQLHLLVLAQALKTMVALASGTHAVLADTVEDAENGETEGSELASNVDRVTRGVLGRVPLDVGPSI